MTISTKIYERLIAELTNYADRDAYASDLALSSMWGDDADADILGDRAGALGDFYDLAHMSIRGIASAAKVSQTYISRRFCVPLRTVQGWAAPVGSDSHRDCPMYITLMMAECLGLMPFEIA